MTTWLPDEAASLAADSSLHLTVGPTPHPGVELGMVVVDDNLYVRAFRGPQSRWFRAALTHGHGRITTVHLDREVRLRADISAPAVIDAAYREKYGPAGTLVDNPAAREATLRIDPA